MHREKRRCPQEGVRWPVTKKTISEADESQIKRIRKTTLRIGIFEFSCCMFTPRIGEDYITIYNPFWRLHMFQRGWFNHQLVIETDGRDHWGLRWNGRKRGQGWTWKLPRPLLWNSVASMRCCRRGGWTFGTTYWGYGVSSWPTEQVLPVTLV